jgi:cytochrome c
MPFGNAQSLSDDDVYAVTAYLLSLNFLVDDDFVLSRKSFAEVAELPNAGAFYMDDRDAEEFPDFVSTDVCMENCKESVEITKRAAVLDVTPEGDGEGAEEAGSSEASADSGDTQEAAEVEEAPEATQESVEMAQAQDATSDAPEADAGADTTDTVEETPATEESAEASAEPDPELVAAGEKLFRQCQACHQIGDGAKNRVGPQLNGVAGRRIGAVEDFKYSNVFAEAHDAEEVWDDERLSAFLMDPRGTFAGTKMSFRGLKDQEEADAMVAYLKAAGQ